MYRGIFLDRDGVIVENKDEYVRSWDDVQFIPGALAALAHLNGHGYKVVIVTNQAGVGRGILTLAQAQALNQQIVQAIEAAGGKVDAAYLCPHAPDELCSCRKPKPGMLLQAAEELAIDLGRSWMIGDAWTDLQAGVAAGAMAIGLVRTGRGAHQLTLPKPNLPIDYFVFNDLPEGLTHILNSASDIP